MKYLTPNKIISVGNRTIEILKTLREIISGRNISVTVPFSAPCFSAREVRGHRHLLKNNIRPSMRMAMIVISKIILNVLVIPA